jgi:transcriptional regulator with XRE-family HTH domain
MNVVDDSSDSALLKEIGRRIAYLRINARLKQEELAEKAGLSRYALSRLENGAGGIRLDSFLSVLRCLNVLNKLSLVLPPPTLTPIQIAEMNRRIKAEPKRVRSKRSNSAKHVWGDGVPIE